jgi:hypothetical protein
MKIHFVLFVVTILFFSCSPKLVVLNKNEFVNNYKFNSEIHQSLLKDSLEPDYQNVAVSFSAKGDFKNALFYWDKQLMFKPKVVTFKKEKIDSVSKKYTVVAAKQFIVNKSIENKIIILNEFHHNGTHRLFTKSLLEELFKNGYKNLCLEALNHGTNEDTLLNKRKYPIQSTGHYINNPQFGELIRTALGIGYKLFPYETKQNIGGEIREKDQAHNMAEIIKDYPDEKFVILCGSGHALEGKVNFFGGFAFAER